MKIEELKVMIAKAESVILSQIMMIEAANVQVNNIDLDHAQLFGRQDETIAVKLEIKI